MSNCKPEKAVLRGSLITFFHLKKTAAKSYRLLVETQTLKPITDDRCRKQLLN